MKQVVILMLMVVIIIPSLSVAQTGNWCITDQMDQIEVEKDPQILERRAKLEEFTQEFIKSDTKTDELIIIPVVFHVVHDYGIENVPLETIEAAMETINKDFRATNSEIASVVPEFQDIIADCKFEFRLAKLDPDGNCTQGVTRTYSLLTYDASNQVKVEVPGWDPSMYLNIWVVNSISGAAAWSHYPGISPTLDGVVSAYNYVSPSSHTLTHEIGHYLNLAHPWGNSNEPDLPSNCNIDDGVEDTPNTIGAAVGSCNKSQTTCGSLDNVQNHMDYASCEAMFTLGQKDRMLAALNSSISDRNNLWTEENLIATGTIDGFVTEPCEPIADFGWDENFGCQGIEIEFIDNTYNGEATSWAWEFEGGEPATSTSQSPKVVYSEPGEYNVTFTSINESGSSTITKEEIIVIADTTAGITYPYVEGFESDDVLDINNEKAWTIINEDAQNDGWSIQSIGDNKVMKADLRLTYNETLSTFISPNINISEADDFSYFKFNLAYAKRLDDTNDELKVYVSTNCGESWSLRYIKSGNTMVTNDGVLVNGFEPEEDQWSEEKITFTNFENVNHFMLKFEVESYKGGELYIDDIKFGEVNTSIELTKVENNFVLYPNPSNGEVNISFENNNIDPVVVQVLNVSGMKMFSKEFKLSSGKHNIKISDYYEFEDGMYIIQLLNFSNFYSRKLVLY